MSVRKNDECCKESAKKGAQAMHDIMKSELEQERKKSAELVEVLEELCDLMNDTVTGEYEPDSVTCQPAIKALKEYKGETKSGACEACKNKDRSLCEHGYCSACGCINYCWID